MEITQTEQQKDIIFETEDSLRDLWDNTKQDKIHIIGVPEGEGRERKGQKIYLKKIMAETSLIWGWKQTPKSRKPEEF